MTMNPLPPQAYTKETLVKAYAWLQAQNENIKELATTPDVLVSLYLRAKIQGDASLERPSIQNFKNELKNLAGMMGEFELVEPNQAMPQGSESASPTIRFRSQDYNRVDKPVPQAPPTQSPRAAHRAENTLGKQPMDRLNSNLALPSEISLDAQSQIMIQEVKSQFNLSSESEALRLLLAIGHHQLKVLIK